MSTSDYLLQIPEKAGVYLFKDHLKNIIYVGKAKSLKKRVRSYFQKTYDWKISALLEEHECVDFILTKNETEALLLEAQLIKQHQPKYNVLLKSGQPFLYVLITNDNSPSVELVRNKKKKGTYFGPFLHKRQARSAYRYLMETFRLEKCTVNIEGGCLRYHIGICAGTCRADFNPQDYLFRIHLAQNLLKGNFKEAQQQITEHIKIAVKERKYEKAQHLHEYLQNLEAIFETLKTKFTETKYEKEMAVVTAPIARLHFQPDYSLAHKIQERLQLEKPISRIDCFDISHFQSNFIVGSCIRFTDGIPDKSYFRRFKIRTLTTQNDYAALQEIITRRYKNKGELPDLVLIDGGKGQLSAAQEVLKNVYIASLAKREETLFMDQFPHGILLHSTDDVGKLLISLRDYAHHFAISYHRLKRYKAE